MTNITRLLITLITVSMLSACGWHLRGSGSLNGVSSVYIEDRRGQSGFVETLEREILARGVNLTDAASGASHQIVLLDLRKEQRTASFGGRGEAAEYSLTKTLTLVILDSTGQPLDKPQTVSVERIYDYDENRAIASSNQAELLEKEMNRDLASSAVRILNRVVNRRP